MSQASFILQSFPEVSGQGESLGYFPGSHNSLHSIQLFVPSSDHSCFSLQDSVLQLRLKTSMLGSGVSTVLWPALQLEACSWLSPGRPTSWLSPVVSSRHMVWLPICRGCPWGLHQNHGQAVNNDTKIYLKNHMRNSDWDWSLGFLWVGASDAPPLGELSHLYLSHWLLWRKSLWSPSRHSSWYRISNAHTHTH